MSATPAHDVWRELAGRVSDGVEIALLWSERDDRVKIAVADVRRGQRFEFGVAGAEALAAFHHPFAYAAARGLAFGRAGADVHPAPAG